MSIEEHIKKYERLIIPAIPYAALPVAISYEAGWLYYHGLPITFLNLDIYKAALALSICALFICAVTIVFYGFVELAKKLGRDRLWGIPRYIVTILFFAMMGLFFATLISPIFPSAAVILLLTLIAAPILISIRDGYKSARNGCGFWTGFLLKGKDDNPEVDPVAAPDIAMIILSVSAAAFCIGVNYAKTDDHYALSTDNSQRVVGMIGDSLIIKKHIEGSADEIQIVKSESAGAIINIK